MFMILVILMQTLQVHNLDHPLQTPLRVRRCDRFWCRLRGLMLYPPLAAGEGMLLVQRQENRRDAAIHMFFMRMDLAVVWLNTNYEVVDVRLAKRWRPAYSPRKPAKYVMEISAEQLTAFQVGDCLRFEALKDGAHFEV